MLYNIYGNRITAGSTIGLENLSGEIVNKVIAVDENTPIFNLLDNSAVSVGRICAGKLNQYYTDYSTSDYIPVAAGQIYVAQAWDTSGSTGYDRVELFSTDKSFVQTYTTAGNGTIRYCVFTPETSGYIRYCYNNSTSANPMVYIGRTTTDTFVAYTGEILNGDTYYEIAGSFRNMLHRDVEPSNLYGKRVYMIGDSNSNNWASDAAAHLEKRYGCRVVGLGQFGATWETTNGEADTSRSNAIGQWNAFVSAVGISEDEYLFPDDIVLLFMMGTNCGTAGTMTDTVADLAEDVSNAIGAQKYILRRAKYFGRNVPIGVFLPWKGQTNEALKKIADYFKIPTFDIPAMMVSDAPTADLERPDGTTVSKNNFTDGGNHLSVWGWEMFKRIAHPWIAYQI